MPPCPVMIDFTIDFSRSTWLLPPSYPTKDRQIWSRSQPRRSSTFIRPLVTRDETENPLLFLRVAKENSVSRASETRVTDGRASLMEMSCMAARPTSHDG